MDEKGDDHEDWEDDEENEEEERLPHEFDDDGNWDPSLVDGLVENPEELEKRESEMYGDGSELLEGDNEGDDEVPSYDMDEVMNILSNQGLSLGDTKEIDGTE